MNMKNIFVAAATILCGCGSDYLLKQGEYKVTSTVNVTTDPLVSEGFSSTWKILHQKEQTYSLTISNHTLLNGSDVYDEVHFAFMDKAGTDSCPFYVTLTAILSPTDQGFIGLANASDTFCASWNPISKETVWVDWNTEYSIVGEFIND
jgi:hypothetical protein